MMMMSLVMAMQYDWSLHFLKASSSFVTIESIEIYHEEHKPFEANISHCEIVSQQTPVSSLRNESIVK